MAAQPEITIRRVRPSDAPALERLYAELSPASRRARFLGASSGLSHEQSQTFCTPDHSHAEGFVAVAGEKLIGHLCLEPVDQRRIELAVAVADAWQRRGIGRRLFEAALEWADRHRCTEIVASAYADNGPVLRLLSSAPYPAMISPADGGVVDVVIRLQAPLPLAWRNVAAATASARRARRAARSGRDSAASRRCRVVWRQTRPPAPGAAG